MNADILGFEYYGNPKDRSNGYINWVSEGKQSWTMKASAVRANPASGVSQRLISEEPMAMVGFLLSISIFLPFFSTFFPLSFGVTLP